MASNPPVNTTPNQPTTKTCGVCGYESPIPPGVDPTNVRCSNTDAMWHAAYYEVLIRAGTARSVIEGHISSCEREMKGLDSVLQSIREDARRIAELIGAA